MLKKEGSFGRLSSMQDVTEWVYDLKEKTLKHWTFDRIEKEWEKRLRHIGAWMDTQKYSSLPLAA